MSIAVLQRLLHNEGARRNSKRRPPCWSRELERDKAHKADGHASIFGLLRSTLGWSDAECRSRTQLARLVEAHPEVGEALFEAWSSVANVCSIARAFANPRCGEQIDGVIGTLLTEAKRMEHGDFRHLPERWQLLNDPGIAGRTRRRRCQPQRRLSDPRCQRHVGVRVGHVRCRPQPGGVRSLRRGRVRGRLGSDCGDSRRPACPALMPRTAAQRAADAMTAIFQRAAAAAPGSKQPKPVGVVHVDWQTFSDWMVEAGLFPERTRRPVRRSRRRWSRNCGARPATGH